MSDQVQVTLLKPGDRLNQRDPDGTEGTYELRIQEVGGGADSSYFGPAHAIRNLGFIIYQTCAEAT